MFKDASVSLKFSIATVGKSEEKRLFGRCRHSLETNGSYTNIV
jgi:hypothetical protein